MSHVGNGEHDFAGLDKCRFIGEETIETLKQARIKARDTIDSIEPAHITSWVDLLIKLEEAVRSVKVELQMQNFLEGREG